MRASLSLVVMVFVLVTAAAAAAENLLARATIESYPATTGGAEAVGRLRDGNLGTPWTNAPGDRGPYEFVFTWEDPVVFGGLRVAVPGGADTTSSARVLKLEIVPEGDLNWFTLKNVKLEPREGYQTFVLPALPTRKLKLTVVRNHGHPVNTYLSEIELLPPLEAGYRESLPGWVQRAGGPVWLHNGVNDTVGAPRPRESLSDLFGLVTGDGGEATLMLADNPSPFGEGRGLIVQAGAFTSLLADRWYDGKPGYEFLLGSGDLTVRALAPGATATFHTPELTVQLVGPAVVQLGCASAWGTKLEVKEGTATLAPLPGSGCPVLRLGAGDVVFLWAGDQNRASETPTVAAGEAPVLDWFATVARVAACGATVKWFRNPNAVEVHGYPFGLVYSAGGLPPVSDTVPMKITEVLRATVGRTGLGGDPSEELVRRWKRNGAMADYLMTGLEDLGGYDRPDRRDSTRLQADALMRSRLRAGIETKPLLLPAPVECPTPDRVATDPVDEYSYEFPEVDNVLYHRDRLYVIQPGGALVRGGNR